MKGVADRIYERYGFQAVVAVGVVVVGIWVVAHYTAAPGGTVSVLWGLVEYTKEDRSSVADAPTALSEGVADALATDSQAAPERKQLTAQSATSGRLDRAQPSPATEQASSISFTGYLAERERYSYLTSLQREQFLRVYVGKRVDWHGFVRDVEARRDSTVLWFGPERDSGMFDVAQCSMPEPHEIGSWL